MLVNGRRGPMAPGPGGALLIRCARCRWKPCEPRYPDFQGGVAGPGSSPLKAPLLDVLRRRVWIHGREAHGGLSQHRIAEVQVGGDDAGRGSEVVALLRFREDVRNIVALVAPGVLIHRRIEDSERRMQHQADTWEIACAIPKRGAKLCVLGYIKPLG